jgi:hypothetical protein
VASNTKMALNKMFIEFNFRREEGPFLEKNAEFKMFLLLPTHPTSFGCSRGSGDL